MCVCVCVCVRVSFLFFFFFLSLLAWPNKQIRTSSLFQCYFHWSICIVLFSLL
jgi:hypothetical protein